MHSIGSLWDADAFLEFRACLRRVRLIPGPFFAVPAGQHQGAWIASRDSDSVLEKKGSDSSDAFRLGAILIFQASTMKRIEIHERAHLLPEDLDWMLRQARRLTRCSNDAEDLVQETCVEWLRRGPEERGQGPRPWLARVLRTKKALEVRHASAARARELAVAPTEEIQSHEVEIIEAEFRRALLNEIDELPPSQGQAVTLCILEGMSITDAAHQRGIARPTCSAHLSQGLRTLERRINGGGPARRWLNSMSALLPTWWVKGADRAPKTYGAARLVGAGALVVATGAVAVRLLDGDSGLPRTETLPTLELALGSEPSPSDVPSVDLPALEALEPRVEESAGQPATGGISVEAVATAKVEPLARLDRLMVDLEPGSVSQKVLARLVTLRDSSGREHRLRVNDGEPAEFKDIPIGPAVIVMTPRAALALEQKVDLKEGMDSVVLKWDSLERLEVEVHVEGATAETDQLVSQLSIVAAPGSELRVDPILPLYSVSKSRWTALEGKWTRNAGDSAAWTQRIQRRQEARYIHVLSGGRTVVATAEIPSGRARHPIHLDADAVHGAFGKLEVQLEGDHAFRPGTKVELLTNARVHTSVLAGDDGHASFTGIAPGDYLVRATTEEGLQGARACRVAPMAAGGPVTVSLRPEKVQERHLVLENVPSKAKRVSVTMAYPVAETGEHMLRRWQLPFMEQGTIEIPGGVEFLSVIAAPQGVESPWIALAGVAQVEPASELDPARTPIVFKLQPKLMHQYTGAEVAQAFSFRMTPLAADGAPAGPAVPFRTDSRYYLARHWIAGDYRFQLLTVTGDVCLDQQVTLTPESASRPLERGAEPAAVRGGR